MVRTAGRVLRLLAMLQGRRTWTGLELSERLGVDARTIRRDVDRLRELGYVIHASAGPGGGYRLGAGNATPPLLLEDDEAVAVAVALSAAAGSVAGIQELALQVLVKLDQLMPGRLRHRLRALQDVTVPLAGALPKLDPGVLTAIASACQDRESLRFTYRNRRGDVTERSVEPVGLVHTGRVWYLAAWDLERDDWRTFRVDRVDAQVPLGRGARFLPRTPPEDLATFVKRSIASSEYRFVVRLRLEGSAAQVSACVPRWIGALEPIDDSSCLLTIGADTYEWIAASIAHIGMDFTLLEPAEVIEPVRAIALRLLQGTGRADRVVNRRGVEDAEQTH
jgi:predicted DNA-binding transcriptional regulator YafY